MIQWNVDKDEKQWSNSEECAKPKGGGECAGVLEL